MLNEKMFGVIKQSILKDRNLENGVIIKQIITDKDIQLVVRDSGDVVQVKRETKENLRTYWNITMSENHETASFISENHITFTEFRKEIESIVNDISGDIDLDECVTEALQNLASSKLTSNASRVQKSHNAAKKKEEIHGEKEELPQLPQPEQPDEPLALDPPAEMKEAEKVEEIEEAEIVEEEEGEEIAGEKKEDEGLKAAEEFLEKQKPKKKAGRPKKQPESGV